MRSVVCLAAGEAIWGPAGGQFCGDRVRLAGASPPGQSAQAIAGFQLEFKPGLRRRLIALAHWDGPYRDGVPRAPTGASRRREIAAATRYRSSGTSGEPAANQTGNGPGNRPATAASRDFIRFREAVPVSLYAT